MFSPAHQTEAMESLCALLSRVWREIETFRKFLVYDWKDKPDSKGYGTAITSRWQHALLAQLSVLVLLAYLHCGYVSPSHHYVLSWMAAVVLVLLSVILLPYAIYILADFLFFLLVRYLGHGLWMRYPLYRTRQSQFEAAMHTVGDQIADDNDDEAYNLGAPLQDIRGGRGYALHEEEQHE